MYDPTTARFLQEDDPSYGDSNDPLSLNLYTYAANNPLMYYDPTGHWPDFVDNFVSDFKEGWNMLTDTKTRNESFQLMDQYGTGFEKNMAVVAATATDTIKGAIDSTVLAGQTVYDDLNYGSVQVAHVINQASGMNDESWYAGAEQKAYDKVNANVESWKTAGKGIVTSVRNTIDVEKAGKLFDSNAKISERVEYADSAINTAMTVAALKGGIEYAAGKFETLAPNASLKFSTALDSVKVGISDMLPKPRMSAITPEGFEFPMMDEPLNISRSTVNEGFGGIDEANTAIRNRVLNNIAESKAAREASNYGNPRQINPGERTLEGFVNDNVSVQAEVGLYTKSPGFNNNVKTGTGGQFKRFGTDEHHGLKPHVHQPLRNINSKTGEIFGRQGKTVGKDVFSPSNKDVKQLYDYLYNGKYLP